MSEHEELAALIEATADSHSGLWPGPLVGKLYRAAALLREARPQPVPVADGEREEREELATFLTKEAVAMDYWFERDTAKKVRRAAALLRQPAPAPVPVPVAEQPWKRPGWCDARGRCWWFAPTEAISGGFRCAGWSLYAADPADEDTHCLPHWAIAIPQPPQGGEVE